jgi:hypothetical protein
MFVAITGIFPLHAQPGPAAGAQDCFFLDRFEGWRAPDASTIYIRVRPDRYYRLDLAGQCQKLRWPGSHLITSTRGKSTVCSARDWDLAVSEPDDGVPQQCIVRSMTRLTPADVASLPKPMRP